MPRICISHIPSWISSAQSVLTPQPVQVAETYFFDSNEYSICILYHTRQHILIQASIFVAYIAHMVVILLLLLSTCILSPQAVCSSLVATAFKGIKARRTVLSKVAIMRWVPYKTDLDRWPNPEYRPL